MKNRLLMLLAIAILAPSLANANLQGYPAPGESIVVQPPPPPPPPLGDGIWAPIVHAHLQMPSAPMAPPSIKRDGKN